MLVPIYPNILQWSQAADAHPIFGNNNGVIDTDSERAQVLKAAIAARKTVTLKTEERFETYVAEVLVTTHLTWSTKAITPAISAQSIRNSASRLQLYANLESHNELVPHPDQQFKTWNQKADACGNDNGLIDTDFERGELLGFIKNTEPRGKEEGMLFKLIVKACQNKHTWFAQAPRFTRELVEEVLQEAKK